MIRLIFILSILSVTPTLGQNRIFVVPDSLRSEQEVGGIELPSYAQYLEDDKGSFEVYELFQGLHDENFKMVDGEFGYESGRVYWLRLQLQQSFSFEQEFLLDCEIDLGQIQVYESPADQRYSVKVAGGSVSPRDRTLINDFTFDFVPISLRKGELKTILLKVELGKLGRKAKPVLRLYNAAPVRENWRHIEIRSIIFLSVFAAMILYNFFLFLITRESIYLTYSLWGTFIAILTTSIYFLPQLFSTFHSVKITQISLTLFGYFWVRFVIDFLELRPDHQLEFKILKYFSYGLLFFSIPFWHDMLTSTAHYPESIQQPTLILCVSTNLVIVSIGFKLYFKNYRPAKYFLIANTPFLLGSVSAVVPYLMAKWGYLDFYDIRYYTFFTLGASAVTQIVLFGLAIGYRILRLEKDRSFAIQDKLESQESINVQLEQKVTERTSQLEHRNRENELLLGEIHHRVKNNLQVISSLLKLQSRQLDEGKAKNAVLEGRDRVKAMALIHQRLYQQDKFSAIEMHDYIQNLVENLAQSYGYGKKDFTLNLEVPELHLDVDTAVPLGLIINELVSNSFKHAFENRGGNVLRIELYEDSNKLGLKVVDNGPGFNKKEFVHKHSFGLELIDALTEELNGDVIYENGEGTSVKLNLKDYKILDTI